MSKRRWGWRLLAGVAAWALALPGAAAAAAQPAIHGTSAAILDVNTGQILWDVNGTQRVPMASTTKMMTALVALLLEHDQTGMTVTIPPQVQQAYGERLGLVPGTSYTLQQLLEAMLLPSDNDAAIAVAVATAGSQRRFVVLMNAEARLLGLTDTHYANPDGLDDPEQYSSAIDLARLGDVVMMNPVIRSIVALPAATLPSPTGNAAVVVGNINPLLGWDGVLGVKTGYTSEALNLAVEYARRGGQGIVGVVTGEPAYDLVPDAEAVVNYGFELAGGVPPDLPEVGQAPAPVAGASLVPYSGLGQEEAALLDTPLPPGFSLQDVSSVQPPSTAAPPAAHPDVAGPHRRVTRAGGGAWAAVALAVVGAVAVLALTLRLRRRRWVVYRPLAWGALERVPPRSASGE